MGKATLLLLGLLMVPHIFAGILKDQPEGHESEFHFGWLLGENQAPKKMSPFNYDGEVEVQEGPYIQKKKMRFGKYENEGVKKWSSFIYKNDKVQAPNVYGTEKPVELITWYAYE